jgi:hypothetical protein
LSEIFQLELVRNLKYLINFIIAFKHFLINFLIVSFESGVMHLDTSMKILKANIALSRGYFLFAAKLSLSFDSSLFSGGGTLIGGGSQRSLN